MVTIDSPEVGSDDDEVNVREVLGGFEFNHDEVGDEQVEAMHADLCTPIQHWYRELSLKRDVALPQLDRECIFID